ncbi:heparan-alpha-glucosaminide N-acetyltransferase domain-containing protein [Kocuria rosea]|uniref:heparan-alpha-glucosaminide N-acetyltransferase domain-containing protein n=1 Tax=Kocuria rosea TaxID=1275 RepID=UPI00203FC238|nr:heparan-alpha-glucosaminide N-acetyltransferase domain-containing protein [Kocuria rosea]
MSWTPRTAGPALAGAADGARRSSRWWDGIDAARGLALLGLLAVHLLPADDHEIQEPTWSGLFLSEAPVALLALLAGVGLAFDSGGRFPHRGRWLAADRMGMAVQAILMAAVGLGVGALMPEGAPADNILIYYAVFLVLAIPFLHLSATALFVCAALMWIAGPLLMQVMADVVPAYTSSTPTSADGGSGAAGTISQLLFTGLHPILSYMTCLLVGLGLGRVRLRDTGIQVRVLAVGAALLICAQTASWASYAFGGYDRLLTSNRTSMDGLGEALVWGSDVLPTNTPWWPALIPAPTDTAWTIAAGLGVGLLVLGSLLLATRKFGAWLLPLPALGAMGLTLYTAHLVALSFQAHHGQPSPWYLLHLVVAALGALAWRRAALGPGPLERVVSTSVETTRRAVLHHVYRR